MGNQEYYMFVGEEMLVSYLRKENDMARYIDADKFREKAFYADTEADIVHYIRLYGYADVIPKSEVEAMVLMQIADENEREADTQSTINVLEQMLCEKDRDIEQLEALLDQTISEMYYSYYQIFDEVEKIILENTYPYFDKDGKPCNIWKAKSGYDALAELKKKYTESEGKDFERLKKKYIGTEGTNV